jgi:hypothetical protein
VKCRNRPKVRLCGGASAVDTPDGRGQEVTKPTLLAVATDEHNESRAGCNNDAW